MATISEPKHFGEKQTKSGKSCQDLAIAHDKKTGCMRICKIFEWAFFLRIWAQTWRAIMLILCPNWIVIGCDDLKCCPILSNWINYSILFYSFRYKIGMVILYIVRGDNVSIPSHPWLILSETAFNCVFLNLFSLHLNLFYAINLHIDISHLIEWRTLLNLCTPIITDVHPVSQGDYFRNLAHFSLSFSHWAVWTNCAFNLFLVTSLLSLCDPLYMERWKR